MSSTFVCSTDARAFSGARAQRASEAPLLSKFGNLSIREILVVTSAYVRSPARPPARPPSRRPSRPYRLWGRGRRVQSRDKLTGWSGEYHLFLVWNRAVLLGNRPFSWLEIAWLPSLFKNNVFESLAYLAKRFSSTEVKFRTLEKISNIYKRKKVKKNTQLSFWWNVKSSSYEICLHLWKMLEFAAFGSGSDAKTSKASALCFFMSTTMVFAAVWTHFPRKIPVFIVTQ